MPLVTPLNAKLQDLARTLSSALDAELADIGATRRALILAPLLAALPAALLADPAQSRKTLCRCPQAASCAASPTPRTMTASGAAAKSPPSSAFSAKPRSS